MFPVSGDGRGYLYLLEQSAERLTVIHPPSGQVLPSEREVRVLRPQPTWLTEADPELPAWRPLGWGTLTYLLVASPAPRDLPSGRDLVELEQLLAPPPFVQGPAAGRGSVVAQRSVQRPVPPGGVPEEEGQEPEGEEREGQEQEGEEPEAPEPEAPEPDAQD